MYCKTSLALSASILASSAALADVGEFTLAKSAAHKATVFAAGGAAWCRPSVQMRMVLDPDSPDLGNQNAQIGLMNLLRTPLENDCPSAVDGTIEVFENGKSTGVYKSAAVAGWVFASDAPAPAPVAAPAALDLDQAAKVAPAAPAAVAVDVPAPAPVALAAPALKCRWWDLVCRWSKPKAEAPAPAAVIQATAKLAAAPVPAQAVPATVYRPWPIVAVKNGIATADELPTLVNEYGRLLATGNAVSLSQLAAKKIAVPEGYVTFEFQGWLPARKAGRYQIAAMVEATSSNKSADLIGCSLVAVVDGSVAASNAVSLSPLKTNSILMVGLSLEHGLYQVRAVVGCKYVGNPYWLPTKPEQKVSLQYKTPDDDALRSFRPDDFVHQD